MLNAMSATQGTSNSRISWECNIQCAIPHYIDRMVVIDPEHTCHCTIIRHSTGQLSEACERTHHYLPSTSLPRIQNAPHCTRQYYRQACTSLTTVALALRTSVKCLLWSRGECEPCTGSSGAQVPSNGCLFPSLCRKLRGYLAWGLGGCCHCYRVTPR